MRYAVFSDKKKIMTILTNFFTGWRSAVFALVRMFGLSLSLLFFQVPVLMIVAACTRPRASHSSEMTLEAFVSVEASAKRLVPAVLGSD